MSTFYGGEQLSQIIDISRTSAGVSSYTVPVGFYGIVKYCVLRSTNIATSALRQYVGDGVGTSFDIIAETTGFEIGTQFKNFVPSGDRIDLVVGGFAPGMYGRFILELYKKP